MGVRFIQPCADTGGVRTAGSFEIVFHIQERVGIFFSVESAVNAAGIQTFDVVFQIDIQCRQSGERIGQYGIETGVAGNAGLGRVADQRHEFSTVEKHDAVFVERDGFVNIDIQHETPLVV